MLHGFDGDEVSKWQARRRSLSNNLRVASVRATSVLNEGLLLDTPEAVLCAMTMSAEHLFDAIRLGRASLQELKLDEEADEAGDEAADPPF